MRNELICNGGKGLSIADTRKFVQAQADEYNQNRDKLTMKEGADPVGDKCVQIYHEQLAQSQHISLRRNVARKTVLWEAAEDSL
jgi:hypothetical protein